ncbi:CRISPR system precrRNA processing endoribonuclease RAMP protein Cas6 [Azonexus sp.]|uniref:CRISPR system precrRNA processing endoribonuclease RAMP protein Cas6 n=1 Tax=Azonexus sp. TaxID=1872668 RepID=UPI0035B1E0F8
MDDQSFAFPDFPLQRIRFIAGSLGLHWPQYAGGILRGGFGMALRRVSPPAWDELFGREQGDSLFVPYMLVPPRHPAGECAAGERFEFELRLFGNAVRHYSACREALALLGKLGLGRERGQFVLLGAANVRPDQAAVVDTTGGTWENPARLQPSGFARDWLAPVDGPVDAVSIVLETPLRLKHAGHLLGRAPSFGELWCRLHARITLAAGGAVLDRDTRRAMDEQAAAVMAGMQAVRWQDWTRYSARQGTEMKFGGLTGQLDYRGNLSPFLPWLNLGSALGLGGKTTFGLGCYRLQSGAGTKIA